VIISNYSSVMAISAQNESASAAKAITSDQSKTHLSSSGSQTQAAIADPAKNVDKLSSQGASVSQTSVSASQAATHQSSDKSSQQVEADKAVTQNLAQRDREVKNHERIHASIGGAFASAPNFSYQKGPDGQLYAVGGDVSIDTSAVAGDPRATLEKAQVIIRAALSVSEPSVQDRRVAAQARVMATEAQAEMALLESPNEKVTQTDELDAADKSSRINDDVKNEKEINSSKDSDKDEQESDDKNKDRKTLAQINAETTASAQAVTESLQEFNSRLNDINKTLHDINLRLVGAGVFQKLFPEGTIIDKNV
jgi:hypothetical protein